MTTLRNLKRSYLLLSQEEKIKLIEEIRNRKIAIESRVATKPIHKKIKEKLDISNMSVNELDKLINKLKGL